jgi:hypothetical protein
MKTTVEVLPLAMLILLSVSCASVQKTPAYSAAPVVRAAEYVEITIDLDSTWQSRTKTNHYSRTARCIVGTNVWFFEGDFLGNAKAGYWLIGTNVIEHIIITSSMDGRPAGQFVSEYPQAGEKFTKVHSSPQGQPAGEGIANAVWLAFCSGTYLKQVGRQIPMPLGPSSQAFGYSDRTVVFEDILGLPKSVELYTTNGQLVCKYEVLRATNFFGRTFPLEFRLVQNGQPANGRARGSSKSELLGRVTSIQPSKQPELPDEVRKELEK